MEVEEKQNAADKVEAKSDAKPPPVASKNEVVAEEDTKDDDDADDDVQLALEYMETAWSILDQYSENPSSYDKNYNSWAKEQIPRFLTGIGDVLSAMKRHADATDAYLRALGHRQKHLSEFTSSNDEASLDFLQCRRRLVETNVLIAEELLACPPEQDVVTTESKDVLVSAAERVDYARRYHDKAQDELQETVLLMGA